MEIQGLLEASKVTLIQRGNGTGPDGDAGWEKMWRAACWAQLGDAARFYNQLSASVSLLYQQIYKSDYIDSTPFQGITRPTYSASITRSVDLTAPCFRWTQTAGILPPFL
jgi:alpha-L-fucosidase 2